MMAQRIHFREQQIPAFFILADACLARHPHIFYWTSTPRLIGHCILAIFCMHLPKY